MKRGFTRAGQRFANLIGSHKKPLSVERTSRMKFPLLRIRRITKQFSAACPTMEFLGQARYFAE